MSTNGTVTLHCELGDHDWERPKQRGQRPRSCPVHVAQAKAAAEAAQPETARTRTATLHPEAQAVFESQSPGWPLRVIDALLKAEMPIPRYEARVSTGLTPRELSAVERTAPATPFCDETYTVSDTGAKVKLLMIDERGHIVADQGTQRIVRGTDLTRAETAPYWL